MSAGSGLDAWQAVCRMREAMCRVQHASCRAQGARLWMPGNWVRVAGHDMQSVRKEKDAAYRVSSYWPVLQCLWRAMCAWQSARECMKRGVRCMVHGAVWVVQLRAKGIAQGALCCEHATGRMMLGAWHHVVVQGISC